MRLFLMPAEGSMELEEFRIKNGDVELHGIMNVCETTADSAPPIVIIPGLWGEAEQFKEILRSLLPRKSYAISLRGRGKSDVPESGYSLGDHVLDIQALVIEMSLENFTLVSVSAGAGYAIAYAAEANHRLSSLIVTDYPAIVKSYPPEMIQGVLSSVHNVRISEKFLVGLQKETVAQDLAIELRNISCPVTVLRGAKKGTYLTDDDIRVYRRHTEKISVRVLSEVSHDPLDAPLNFIEALKAVI
jgi:pimeloyl-ACP methyl ester carboxylesterase